MITDAIRNKTDKLGETFRTGGLANAVLVVYLNYVDFRKGVLIY